MGSGNEPHVLGSISVHVSRVCGVRDIDGWLHHARSHEAARGSLHRLILYLYLVEFRALNHGIVVSDPLLLPSQVIKRTLVIAGQSVVATIGTATPARDGNGFEAAPTLGVGTYVATTTRSSLRRRRGWSRR